MLMSSSSFVSPLEGILRLYFSSYLDTNLARDAIYRGADKSFFRPGRKQATATEEF